MNDIQQLVDEGYVSLELDLVKGVVVIQLTAKGREKSRNLLDSINTSDWLLMLLAIKEIRNV